MAEYKWWDPRTYNWQNNPAYQAGQSYYDLTRGENAPPEADDPFRLAKDLPSIYKDAWDTRAKPAIENWGAELYEDAQEQGGLTRALVERLKNLKTPLPFTDANVGDAFKGWENIGERAYNENWLTDNPIYRWGQSLARDDTTLPPAINADYPNEGDQFTNTPFPLDPNWQHQLRMQDIDRGNIDNKGFQWPSILGGILSGFKDNPEEAFGRDYFNLTDTGRVAGSPVDNLYSGMNVSSMFGKGLDAAGQKRIDKIQGTLDKWEADREKYAAQLATTTLYDRLKNFKKQQGTYQGDLNTATGQGGTKVIPPVITAGGTGAVTTGGGGGFNPVYDRAPPQERPSWHGATQARQAAGKQVAGPGFGRGAYWADGGRVGYQGGELVEQQTDFIEGPQGGEEFQETVVEGQQQPSREQLEALAMHIFQLPLDDLDDQQLVVVYQAAMQGQPMEEAVQEEDVQFAANGGRAGYRWGRGVEDPVVEELQIAGDDPREFEDIKQSIGVSPMASGTDPMSDAFDMYNDAIKNGTFDGTFDEFLEELERVMNKFRAAEGGLASIL